MNRISQSLILLLLAAPAAFAQAEKEASPTQVPAAPADETKRPNHDKTLLQQRIDDNGTTDVDDDQPHFKVQQPLSAEDQKPRFERPKYAGDGERVSEHHHGYEFVPGYFQIGLAYVHSRWSEFSPDLHDGSMDLRLGFFRQFGHVDAGLALNLINGDNHSGNNENMYAFSFGLEGLYRLGDGMVQGLGGLGFHVGNYRAWAVESDNDFEVAYAKLGDGFLVGLTPQLGLRFKMSPRFSVDLMAQYLGYVGTPAWRVGGWTAGLNFNFSRWEL